MSGQDRRDWWRADGGAGAGDQDSPAAPERLAWLGRVDLGGLGPLSRAVTEHVIGSTGDVGYAHDLVCSEPWLEAAVAALATGAPVIADAVMTAAGIDAVQLTTGQLATGQRSSTGQSSTGQLICKVGQSLTERLARTTGIPVAAAAVRLAFGDAGPGAVWVVGSEPAAVYEILSRNVQPALVIATPAGFVAAPESKKTLRGSGLPSLTNAGEKGGPAVAAAACRALLAAAERAVQPAAR